MNRVPVSPLRRALLGAAALAPAWPGATLAQAQPDVPALRAYLAGRAARMERVTLDIPRIADNGNVIPVRMAVAGPFAPGAEVKSLHLFSEKNPVPQMAVFHFPVPVKRVEVESRVRLAGTQRVAAVATLADGTLLTAVAEVIVTISACIDGT